MRLHETENTREPAGRDKEKSTAKCKLYEQITTTFKAEEELREFIVLMYFFFFLFWW